MGLARVTGEVTGREGVAQSDRAAAYDHVAVEQKWLTRWAKDALYRTPAPGPDRAKYYCLDFFPYPSGNGLSVGHGRNYVPERRDRALLPHVRAARCSIRWAGTPSGCPPRMRRSSAGSILQRPRRATQPTTAAR